MPVDFDSFAIDYDAALNRGISVSGEDKTYFARGRLDWLSRCLNALHIDRPRSIIDFGCGSGAAVPFVFEIFQPDRVVGLDVSRVSVQIARERNRLVNASFHVLEDYAPTGQVDLVFCNGVFHHIPLQQRRKAIRYVYRCLKPGGVFAMWENNPWNPAARYVMSRIPFDKRAILVTPAQARKLMAEGGLRVLQTDHYFIFPRSLRFLRGLEPHLARLPFGAQYQVLAQRPID